MSQRTERVASLVHQAAAAELAQLPGAAYLTVTNVDVAPDLRTGTVWVGVIARKAAEAEQAFAVAEAARDAIQSAVARKLTTKFVPRLSIKRDSSGEYADSITRLIKGL